MDFNQSNQQDLLNAENLYATLVGRVTNVYGSNYVDSANVAASRAANGAQTNPEALGSGGSRDIQFRVQLQF